MNIFKEIDFTKSISMVNSISFIGLSIEEYTKSFDFEDNDKEALRYSSLLLGIAGIHYSILDVNQPSPRNEILIRYSDWILTTPLLLVVFGKYYNIDMDIIKKWIGLNIIMILGGLMYELYDDINYWIIGTVAYLVLIYNIDKTVKEKDLFYKYFLVGWSLYGIISLMPIEKRFFFYNVLDFYNKFIFAYEVRLKIINRKKESTLSP